MKDLRNFCFFLTLFFTYTITHGQTFPKNYFKTEATFRADSILTPPSIGMMRYYVPSNHVWLTSLNSYYIETPGNKINVSAIPAYTPIKKNALTNPYSPLNQMIGAMLPYGYYFPSTLYGLDTYGSYSRTNPTFQHGYSPYNLKAPGSPYLLSPKF